MTYRLVFTFGGAGIARTAAGNERIAIPTSGCCVHAYKVVIPAAITADAPSWTDDAFRSWSAVMRETGKQVTSATLWRPNEYISSP